MSGKICTHLAVNGSGEAHELPLSYTLDVEGKRIRFIDAKQDESFDFSFDGVSKGKKGLDENYGTVLEGLANQTAAGGSAMCVMCGSPALDTHFFLPTKGALRIPGHVVYLKRVAAQLLKACPDEGCVTFSWFNVATKTGEQITDVLRAASNPKSAGGDPTLILREVGRARGMTVPGLTQVELGASADVEAVVKHVQQVLPAHYPGADHHSVLQFTYSVSREALHKTSGSKSIVVQDKPGVGRLTFVLLSALTPEPPLRFNSEESGDPQDVHGWVESLAEVLEAPGAPLQTFNRSRLLLLLRDAILGRQPAGLVLSLQLEDDANSADAFTWLQLVSQIEGLPAQAAAGAAGKARKAAPQQQLSAMREVPEEEEEEEEEEVVAPVPVPVPATKGKKGKGMTNKGGKGATADLVPTGTSVGVGVSDLPPVPSSVRSTTFANPIATDASLGAQQQQQQQQATTPPRKAQGGGRSLTFLTNRDEEAQGPGGISISHPTSPTKLRDAETIQVLMGEIDVLQAQEEDMRCNLDTKEDQYLALRSAYDGLVLRLQEEAPTLRERDRSVFLRNQQNLRDYEVYKEVMETAMVKLQNEVEALVREKGVLQGREETAKKAIMRQKTHISRYESGASLVKKENLELLKELDKASKVAKKTQREREAAVSALTGLKLAAAKRERELLSAASMSETGASSEKSKFSRLEASVRQLTLEKRAAAEEAAKLRQAHSKVLNTLMGYQEENSALRSALEEFVDGELPASLSPTKHATPAPAPAAAPSGDDYVDPGELSSLRARGKGALGKK